MNYFEFYAGDYVRDTADLSLAEHGAYLLLMSTYYASEKPLQVDYPSMYRICRVMSKAEQAAVTAVANRFFPIGDDKLRHNARADREIAKAQKRISSARQNGEKGGRPPKTPEEPKTEPKQEPKNNPIETQQKPTGFQSGNPVDNPLGTPPETHSGEALHAPCSTHQSLSKSVPAQKRGSRTKTPKTPWSDAFAISERVERWAKEKGFGRLPEHFEAFRSKCRANGYAYADWDDAFMEAIRGDWAKLRNNVVQHPTSESSPAAQRRLA